jgi:hypothetical protein
MAVVVGTLFAFVRPTFATLTVVYDRAFIDNRPTVATAGYNDPLLTGLNLNLEIGVSDSVGGSAALSTGTASFTSSNPAYSLDTSMSFDGALDATTAGFGATPPGVTVAQFPNIAGTFTYTVTDANGSIMDTSHNLSFLEALNFPTFSFSNNSTTPTITLTDTNSAPPSGITRAYDLRILNAGQDGSAIFSFSPQLGNSFMVSAGVLIPGQPYDFRGQILDANTAEVAPFLAGGIHDPTEDRSVGWAFNFSVAAVPEPSTPILLVSGLLGLGRVVWRRFGAW